MKQSLNSEIDLLPGTDTEALIFDCDGTLIHSAPFHRSAINKSVEALNITMTPEWHQQRIGLSLEGLIDAFRNDFGVTVELKTLVYNHTRFYLEKIHGLDPLQEIDAVTAVVRQFFGKLPMAVASNSNRRIVEASLKAIGLDLVFNTLVTRDDVIHGKPAPDAFLEAARRLGKSPEKCLVFEDSDEGIEAAHLAGMPTKDVRHFNRYLVKSL